MYDKNQDCSPDSILATHKDPRNVILNVSKQESVGLVTSGANPPATGAQGVSNSGFVASSNNEAVTVPGSFSEDPGYTQTPDSGDPGGYVPGGGSGGDPLGDGGDGRPHREDLGLT